MSRHPFLNDPDYTGSGSFRICKGCDRVSTDDPTIHCRSCDPSTKDDKFIMGQKVIG